MDVSRGEKLYPLITSGYPPPIEPEDIDKPVTTILYYNFVFSEILELPIPETATITLY